MNPVMTHRVGELAAQLNTVAHGGKHAAVTAFARDHGLSPSTVWRRLRAWRVAPRRRRDDAQHSALRREEARLIAAYLLASARRNGKQLASLAQAVTILRANGRIEAGRLDPDTGEWRLLSTSAISRALRGYGMHPTQLGRPSPKVALASRHPNHVWQSDASLCVLYYLTDRQGLQVMDADRFYKNKPQHVARIAPQRVWRYVFVDHTSGAFYVEYVLGAESGANHLTGLIQAMQYRGADDPFHGVPAMLMVDPGSANTSHAVRQLCHALGITLQVNQPGRPWAKGSVEKTHDLIERGFEQGLKFLAVDNLAHLNTLAHRWMRHVNGSAIHTRTGRTRYAVWHTITPAQLRLAPDTATCRALALEAPQTRRVSAQLTVQWRGHTFDVAEVPGVAVGEPLNLTRDPWGEDTVAQALVTHADGHTRPHAIHAITVDSYGFPVGAPVIGERYAARGDTVTDTERKAIERLTMQARTDTEAKQKRHAKVRPFGGEIDPYRPLTEATVPLYARPTGTASPIASPDAPPTTLSHVQAAQQLRRRLGTTWGTAHFAALQRLFPDGVPTDQIDGLADTVAVWLTAPADGETLP